MIACAFRADPVIDSDNIRSVNPIWSGHGFRDIRSPGFPVIWRCWAIVQRG